MKKTLLVFIVASVVSTPAFADWHYGTIESLNFNYDGSTISFHISGWSRTNCTCDPSWPYYMCLDRTRTSFKEEYAWLLAARRAGVEVGVSINETTCRVVAITEG